MELMSVLCVSMYCNWYGVYFAQVLLSKASSLDRYSFLYKEKWSKLLHTHTHTHAHTHTHTTLLYYVIFIVIIIMKKEELLNVLFLLTLVNWLLCGVKGLVTGTELLLRIKRKQI